MSKRPKLSDELRQAIEQSPMSRYALAKLSGVDAAILCRFVAGERGMGWASIDALAGVLDLHITIGKPRARKAGNKQRKGR